jgi:uncharacterized membrane protein
MEKTASGLQENVAGLLCYVLGWVSGLVFYLIETENKFVRFHAMQSIIVFGAINALWIIVWVPLRYAFLFSSLPYLISWLFGVAALVLWIVLIVKAYQGTMYKLPVVGDLAEKWSSKKAG